MGASGSRKARMARHRMEAAEARQAMKNAPQTQGKPSSRTVLYEVNTPENADDHVDIKESLSSCSAILIEPIREEPKPRGAHSEVNKGRWTMMPGEIPEQVKDQLVKKAANIRLVEMDNPEDDEDPKTEMPVLPDKKEEDKNEVVTSYWAKLNPQATQTTSKAVLVPIDEFGKPKQADKTASDEGPKGILKSRDPHSDAQVSSSRWDGSELPSGPGVGRSVSEALPGTLPGIIGSKPISEEEMILKQMKEEGILKVTDVANHREHERKRMLQEVRNMAQENHAPVRLAPLNARRPAVPDALAAGEKEVLPPTPKGNKGENKVPEDAAEESIKEEPQGLPDGVSRECYIMDLELA